jgi:surface protein
MFNGCNSLEKINLSSFKTSKVTDMAGMFSRCRSLKDLDVSSFDTSNLIDMSGHRERDAYGNDDGAHR